MSTIFVLFFILKEGNMQEHTKTVIYLAIIGALIALGKLLQSMRPLSWRIVIGRMITGSAVSTIAGIVLIHVPDIPFPAVMAIGSALGVLGAEFIEAWMKKFADGRLPK